MRPSTVTGSVMIISKKVRAKNLKKTPRSIPTALASSALRPYRKHVDIRVAFVFRSVDVTRAQENLHHVREYNESEARGNKMGPAL